MRPVTVRIGTRGSALALAQTAIVSDLLHRSYPEIRPEITTISTRGDRLLDQPLTDIGDKGFFVSELEEALQCGAIDLAVHSAKDLPTDRPADLALGAVLLRSDPRDVLVSRAGTLCELPPGSRIGTSSPRRACQVRALRPDLDVRPVRGNVDTRVRKLDAGEYDALVLAAAGLRRLGLGERITEWLSPDQMLPAPGQGALALEIRAADSRTRELVSVLDDPATAAAVHAERAFLRALGMGCGAAAAALGVGCGATLTLSALIGHEDGRFVRSVETGLLAEPVQLGTAIARGLVANGGKAFLAGPHHVGT